uniref:ABO, alpha 1-3-N-acetylgalactosaminyltransferase and alpha 1-3-galactosyltransferase n=1 Tax=Felis catus TaxID=9685 RepID=A0ABI7VTU2_FELCA
MVYPQPKVLTPSRKDVLVLTPWLAPIVWEGTFNIDILNEQFRLRNTTIGLTVFAIKKYVAFLELFLQTAEKHFMVGHKVTYYVFTDRPGDVPRVPLGEGRQVVVLEVRSYLRWQDVCMLRMEMISNYSRRRFLHEVAYLVCVDVDMRFRDHVGVEILSPLFGTLHPGFYGVAREDFTYERRPQSQAHVPRDEGEFYYAGGFFGGSVARFCGSHRPVTRPWWSTGRTASRPCGTTRAT